MKKIATLILAAAATMAMSAETVNLWSGSCTFDAWKPIEGDVQPSIAAAAFENAQAGDVISVDVTYYTGYTEDWHAVQFLYWNPDTQYLLDAQVVEDTTGKTYTITAEGLEALKQYGMAVGGAGITVTSVDLVSEETAAPEPGEETLLWSGSCTFDAWKPIEGDVQPSIGADAFGSANVGDEIVIELTYYSEYTEDWHAVQIWCWGASEENIYDQQVVEGDTQQTYTITAEGLEALQGHGMAVGGAGITVTAVKLVAKGADTPPADDDDAVWTGSFVGSWEPVLTIPAEKFASIAAKDKLSFTVTDADADGQIALVQNIDGWPAMPYDGTEEWGNYLHLLEGDCTVTFDVNEAAAATLKANGLIVAGNGYTLTKVEILPYDESLAVKMIVSDEVASPVYNLQGIRVADSMDAVTAPGIYISGGKKYIVK